MCTSWCNPNGIKNASVAPQWLLYNSFSKIRCHEVGRKGRDFGFLLIPLGEIQFMICVFFLTLAHCFPLLKLISICPVFVLNMASSLIMKSYLAINLDLIEMFLKMMCDHQSILTLFTSYLLTLSDVSPSPSPSLYWERWVWLYSNIKSIETSKKPLVQQDTSILFRMV